MFCGICQKDFKECTCKDLEERLDKSEFLVYRKCKLCGKHFARCRCETPIWTTNLGDKYLPEKFLR